MDVGESLSEYVQERLSESVNKYFDRAVDAKVVFTKESHLFQVNIVVNEGTGTKTVMKSDASATGVYAAFDMSLEKIKKQLRRYKRRIKKSP